MKISGLVEKGALIAHTLDNAKLFFREEHIGSLEIGKYADLKHRIGIIKPVITMTNGNIVNSE